MLLSSLFHEVVNTLPHFLKNVLGAKIFDSMHGIKSKGIHMEIPEPHQAILDKVMPDVVTPSVIEINGFPPGSTVLIREIRSVLRQIVAFRAQVIINHIQYYSESLSMTSIDQLLQSFW